MTIVVIPKTASECNQVVSALHSQGLSLWSTSAENAVIKPNESVVILWDTDTVYAVRPLSNPVIDLDKAEHLGANALYNRLRLTAHLLHSQGRNA